jgi:hypothetical protein
MKDAVNMLRDSRITLYTVDPTLLTAALAVTTDADSVAGAASVPGSPPPDPFGKDGSFEALARTTGGKSFYSRNDVDREIGESVRDGENYYTIAHRPTSSSDESKPFRTIRVTLAKPGLHAAYREGYFNQNPVAATKPGTRIEYDMDAAIESPLSIPASAYTPNRNLGLSVPTSSMFRKRNWCGPADGGGESAKLQLIAAVLDKKGRILLRDTQDTTEHRRLSPSGNGGAGLSRLEIRVSFPNVLRGLANG